MPILVSRQVLIFLKFCFFDLKFSEYIVFPFFPQKKNSCFARWAGQGKLECPTRACIGPPYTVLDRLLHLVCGQEDGSAKKGSVQKILVQPKTSKNQHTEQVVLNVRRERKDSAATIPLIPSFWKGLLGENKEENPLQCGLWHKWLEKHYPTTLTGLLNSEADVKMPKAAGPVWGIAPPRCTWPASVIFLPGRVEVKNGIKSLRWS